MKKNQNSVAKTARKEFKKQLTVKITDHLKAAIGNIGADTKKINKAIDKAAKNLAKKLTKEAQIIKPATKPEAPVKVEPETKTNAGKTIIADKPPVTAAKAPVSRKSKAATK